MPSLRRTPALLTLSLFSIACDSGSNSEPSGSPSSSTSTASANTNVSGNSSNDTATVASTATNSSTATTSTTSSASLTTSTSGGGTSSTDGTSAGTDSASNTTASTTGGEAPNGTPYVFTGSTDGVLRVFVMDPSDGSLAAAGAAETGEGLDFIALGPDGRTLFIARQSSLSAYTYDRSSETFTPGDTTETQGGGTYVNVDPTGGYVFVASYNEGLLSFFGYDSAAGFSDGETVAAGMNAHQVRLDPSGRHVHVPCLGENYVAHYDFDPASGALTESSVPTAPAGGGPRHMVFHPAAPIAYVLTENSSQIHVYDVNETSGALEPRPDASVYTHDDEMRHWSSDIQVTPDGRFVYAVNRDEPEIVRFEVTADRSLVRLGSDDLAAVVRAFAVDPKGGYLQVGGANGDLVAYRIDPENGSLSETASQSGLGDIHATVIRYLE